MWRTNTVLLLLLTFMIVLLSPGCATLKGQRTQRIPVTSSPVGATIIVNGVQQGVTPLEIRLARKQKGQVIRIESPGYDPVEIRMKRGFSSQYASRDRSLGLLLGLIAFSYWNLASDSTPTLARLLITVPAAMGGLLLVDTATGAGYALEPTQLIVTLKKADGTPRVETILIDADDLQNIKWIRIHRD